MEYREIDHAAAKDNCAEVHQKLADFILTLPNDTWEHKYALYIALINVLASQMGYAFIGERRWIAGMPEIHNKVVTSIHAGINEWLESLPPSQRNMRLPGEA